MLGHMIKKVIITIIILFVTTMLYTALHAINKHDLSTQKAATCNLKGKGPIYLVTYGDGDVYIANSKVLAESALNNCVDVVYMYRKEHLDEAFVEKNKKILSAKRGAGYWLWKPYIVLKTMQQIPENSIVMFLDSGFKIINPMDRFVNELGNYNMLLVDNPPFLNKDHVKRGLLKLMNMDNDEVRNTGQLSAGMFVMRNTSTSREFLAKWLKICEMGWTIDDSPSQDEYPEFETHRHDQSILSLLYLQDSKGIKVSHIDDLLYDVWLHKRRSLDKSLFVSRGGLKMQMSILGKRLDEVLVWVRGK